MNQPNDITKYYDEQYDYEKDMRVDWKRMGRWLDWIDREIKKTDFLFQHTNRVIMMQRFYARDRMWMLDVGCGVGRTYNWATLRNIRWQGIDISQRACDYARKRLPPYKHDIIQCCRAESMPFPNDSFDFVVALGSIEHMDNPQKALQEMFRVCKHQGLAVILVPNKMTILEGLGLYHGTEQPYELRLSCREWMTMIHDAGFIIHRIRKDYGAKVFKNLKPVKILQRAMLKLTRWLPDDFTYAWIFDCSVLK